MEQQIGKYLKVVELPKPAGRLTSRWELYSMSGDYLGEIQWFGRWRQYCFWPSTSGIVLNSGCMNDISSFLSGQTEARK